MYLRSRFSDILDTHFSPRLPGVASLNQPAEYLDPTTPHGAWVERVLKRQLDDFDGFLRNHKYLIHDRDPLFTKSMIAMLASVGVKSIKLPPKSPNLNAHAERFVRSIKHECLNRIIPIGESHLWRAIDAYVEHYNHDRPHQGMDNLVLDPLFKPSEPKGKIICDEQMGGVIRSYRRAAA